MNPAPKRYRRGENRPLSAVAEDIGFAPEFGTRVVTDPCPERVDRALEWLERSRPSAQNHWPALTLALVAQIDALATQEGVDSFNDILSSNPPETPSSEGGRAVNTLNLTTSDSQTRSVKLRPLYNSALHVIRNIMLRQHPSNAPHATQSWPDYRPLIQMIGAMSGVERRAFAEAVWEIGVLSKPVRAIATVTERTVRPFELVLRQMPTSVPHVRGGAVLQGLAYGYLRADSPNLILETHNVNTGSSRAGMLGDVDGFRGREPELAAEVKDIHLTAANVIQQLGDFLEDIEAAPNVTAVVICRDITDEARDMVVGYFESPHDLDSDGRMPVTTGSITILSVSDLIHRVSVWDVPKQQEALRGLEYFLGRIQKDDRAVSFVRNWLREHDIDAGLGPVQHSEPQGSL